jgi:hypothetical protein
MCPHTAIYVSSYCCIRVLLLLYTCPHTATYVCLGDAKEFSWQYKVYVCLGVAKCPGICVCSGICVSWCSKCPRTAICVCLGVAKVFSRGAL